MVSPDSFITIPIKRFGTRLSRFKANISEKLFVRFILALTREMGINDISNTAAGISYFAVLALFPLILSLLAIMGLFLPSESVQRELITFFAQYLPGSQNILQGNIPDIIRLRSAFGIVGIIGLIWTATGVFSSATVAVNKAWHIQHRHPFYIKKPRELIMILSAGILFVLSFGASAVLSVLGNPDIPFSGTLVNIGTGIIAFLFSLVIFMLVNKFCPVTWVSWRHVWPGAVLSTVLFEVAKTFFVFYINNYHHYDKIYGSITSVIILLIWVYYSAFILVLGAEFNYVLSQLRREGEAFDKHNEKIEVLREF